MHNRSDAQQVGCRSGEMQYSNVRLQESRDAGMEGCKKRGMHERRSTGKEGCRYHFKLPRTHEKTF